VAEGSWHASAAAWAAERQIVNGCGHGQFGPNDPITREQLAVVLMAYAEYRGNDVKRRAEVAQMLRNFVELTAQA
jgi:hypothetical protein